MRKSLFSSLLAVFALAWPGAGEAAKIRFDFDGWQGPSLRVYASRPVGLAPDRPVVFVMHGTRRNADDYRDQWHQLAIEHDFLLVVPEFSRRDFPGSNGYNLGYMRDEEGNLRPRARWGFAAIEPLFDDVKKRFGVNARRYALYGHSAGSQFVHRFIFHAPEARVSRVVAANAGWYSMTDFEVHWPYGLGGSTVQPGMLEMAMSRQLTILLGDADVDAQHSSLRRTPEALAQGANRLMRGQRFFENAQNWSRAAGVVFNWQLEYVEGADHDNVLMAPVAARILVEDR